jgi:hypothetical protein
MREGSTGVRKQALEISKQVLGPKLHDALISMATLAVRRSKQGQSEEAEELKVHVLELRKRVLGSVHHETLHCHEFH